MPEVSVIIPTYNSDQFLEKALQSVFNQTFTDYEIIVVDDGSIDQTRQVIANYRDKINYIYQENGGPSKARNRGIRASSAPYIAFLDADDMWLPSKLEQQIAIFHQRPELGMVSTNAFSFNDRGIIRRSHKRQRLLVGNVARNIFLYDGVGTPTVMVRKKVFDRVGYFDEELLLAEDDNMWVRIAAQFEVEIIEEPLVKIRDHPGRITRNREKLYEMVQTNIDLLSLRYAGVKEIVEKVLPKKVSMLQFEIGYYRFENGAFHEARKAFAKGIRSYWWNWKNVLYFAATLMPPGVIQCVRRIKGKIQHSSASSR